MTIASTQDVVFARSDEVSAAGHEQVVFCRDKATGLKAIIAIHDTRLGPALGGTRFYPYISEAEALTDVLRLSQGMTFKAAAAGIGLGGGKAVILGDPNTVKTPDLLRAYGRFVDTLAGRYYTAADVGTTAQDLDIVGTQTRYVVGSNKGSGDSGFSTAYGVFCAMRAAAVHKWGVSGLKGRSVGVEGIGKVGTKLVELLLDEGATVIASDPATAVLAKLLVKHPEVTARHSVLDAPVDVYAPCAMGATLTHITIPAIRARIVCGAANNQLLNHGDDALLDELGITWVPDYVANAGGLIQVSGEIRNMTDEQIRLDISRVEDTVTDILRRADATNRFPSHVAADVVTERLNSADLPEQAN